MAQQDGSEDPEMAESSSTELKAIQDALAALWPLDDDARARAVAGLAAALGVSGAGGTSGRTQFGAGAGDPSANGTGDLGTPKQFLTHKAPQSDVERAVVLAYYLVHARGLEQFKTADLTELNIKAAGPRVSNMSYAVSNAQKKMGYIANGHGGAKLITARGEALVANLPDRAAAKTAVDALPGKPRRSSATRRKKKDD
jgi:hypothetical protein